MRFLIKPASSGLDHSALTTFGMMMSAIFLIVPIGGRSKRATRSRRIGTALGLLLLVVVLINGCGGNPSIPPPVQPKIGTPVDLGSGGAGINNSPGVGVASMTTTATAPAGGSIIVMAAIVCPRSCLPVPASCTDSAGNSYTTDVSTGVIAHSASICSTHHLAAALPAGSSITATL